MTQFRFQVLSIAPLFEFHHLLSFAPFFLTTSQMLKKGCFNDSRSLIFFLKLGKLKKNLDYKCFQHNVLFCLIEVSSLIFIALGQGYQQGIVWVFLKTFWESAECCISLMPSLMKPRTDDRCWCVDSLTHSLKKSRTDDRCWCVDSLLNKFKSRLTRSQFILNSKVRRVKYHGSSGEKIKIVYEGFCWLF